MKLHQINDNDLSILELELPALMDSSLMQCNDALTRKRWEIVREVIANVRWNYGPPSVVEKMDPDNDEQISAN